MTDPSGLEALAEAVRWLMWDGQRRAGTLGRLVGFEGIDPDGRPARLLKSEGVWRLTDEKGNDSEVHTDEIVPLMKERFSPTQAVVRHDLPALLFQAAVRAAEDSLTEANRAGAGSGLDPEGDEESHAVIEFVLVTSAQDSTVRSAIAAITLAVAAAEAQINAWAEAREGWQLTEDGDEDKLSLVRKCKAVAKKAGTTLEIGRAPYQQLRQVVKRRNALVHSSGADYVVPLTGPAMTPGRPLSVEARESCYIVRLSLVDLAGALGEAPPPYLVYCPPGNPEDDILWERAWIMTGVRDDPVFPKGGRSR